MEEMVVEGELDPQLVSLTKAHAEECLRKAGGHT